MCSNTADYEVKLLIGMDIKEEDKIIQEVTRQEYKEGFVTDVGQDFIPKGLNEDIIRTISRLKEEPEWMLEFRLGAFRKWQENGDARVGASGHARN